MTGSEGLHAQSVFEVLGIVTKALSKALRHRDLYTQLHSSRVIDLSRKLGQRCCLTQHDLNLLEISASLHDIGKIGIEDQILSKPGPLSDSEKEQMKAHAEIGAEIVAGLHAEESDKIAEAIRHHHECYEGSGYPDCLSGEDIPYLSRLISVVDCYDALTEIRPYNQPTDKNTALTIMCSELEARKFDPYMFNKFMRMMEAA
jgi:HD-GYP domain-containing protein (c-di-GMP phosphodiesterase class II)